MSTSGKWFMPSNPIDKHFTQNPTGASISLPWVSFSSPLVTCSAEYKGSPLIPNSKVTFFEGMSKEYILGHKRTIVSPGPGF